MKLDELINSKLDDLNERDDVLLSDRRMLNEWVTQAMLETAMATKDAAVMRGVCGHTVHRENCVGLIEEFING